MEMTEFLRDIFDISPYIGSKPFCGVRYNPLKLSRAEFEALAPFKLTPCPFHPDGYVTDTKPSGFDMLHVAGGFYLQEPSAMSAAFALNTAPDDRVLDMCAAPGSKATAIAPYCKLIVANEIDPRRAVSLIGNVERMGISNAAVTSAKSEDIARAFEGYFDKVLVDSPCSGEGMFRSHPEILSSWSPELVKMCAARSSSILQNAARALRPGGRLIYSTCTYNTEENERVVLDFLKNNPDFEPADTGLSVGQSGLMGADFARRITVKDGGEGQFVCALKRKGDNRSKKLFLLSGAVKAQKRIPDGIFSSPLRFHKDNGFFITERGGALYAVQDDLPAVKGVRVIRAGVKLGEYRGRVFIPAHALALAAKAGCLAAYELSFAEAEAYIKGETIPADISGWCAVTRNGLALGLGKGDGRIIKNHYPKGLRRTV